MGAADDDDAAEAGGPPRQRATFLPGREVLERARDLLGQASAALRSAPRAAPRTEMFCDTLESLQEELAGALGRFEEVASDELLEVRTQYTVELPAQLEAPPAGSDPGQTQRWALALARRLREQFLEMAESAHKETLEEIYRNLAELVQGYEQRIARLEEGLRDL